MRYANRGLRRRSGDKWEVVLTYTDPDTNKKQLTYHTVEAKTEAAAKKARDELKFRLESEGAAPSSSTTVQKYMAEYIERRQRGGTVEASTISGYRKTSKMISKYIGECRMMKVTVSDVEKLMSRMRDDSYSPRTCGKALRFLRMVFKDALARDVVKKNPCDFVRPPKNSKTEINVLDFEERVRMLDLAHQAPNSHLSLAVELALATGMRRSEICALRWSDVDDDGVIHVRRSLGEDGGTYYLKDAKSASSMRDVPLAASTFDSLTACKDELLGIASELGVSLSDSYVIAKKGISSEPFNPTILSKEFSTFSQMNGFNCTFHDLRHTFATYAIAAGIDVATVASYLGHANISITLNTYATVDPDAKRTAAATIEKVIGYVS